MMVLFKSLPLAVAAGGALGALGRHYAGAAVLRLTGGVFPWGTLSVNILGGLLMGITVELLALKFTATPALRAFLTVGLLGGFTTFSAFSLEVALMLERHQIPAAGLYVLLSVGVSVTALFAGLMLVRWLA